MLVEVVKSPRRPETYLYVEKGQDFDALPEALRNIFGEPEKVLGLNLTPDKQLARFSGAHVLAEIAEKGFFLQMPDEHEGDESC